MKDKSKSSPSKGNHVDTKDLRNTLLAGGIIIIGFGAMIVASSPHVISLQIPPLETSMMVLIAAMITMTGMFGLQMNWSPWMISWAALVSYTIVITFTIHFTGGPLTPMPVLYLLVVVAASFLLGRRGATFIAILSVVSYAIMLRLEFTGVLPMVQIWGLSFTPQERGALLVVNWLALSIPTLITSQLAGVLAERLKRTNANLIESERMRDNLTHMIVHDLRNPITAMMGGLDIFMMTLSDQMSNDQRRLLENARHSGQVLLGLVNELLDISKMEAGKFELILEPVNVCDLVARHTDAMQAVAELEGQHLEMALCSPHAVVSCDKQLISRVFANLLSNASKFTPEGGTITTMVEVGEDETIVVRVADTGPGIPKEYQEHIFEKFGQVKSKGERRGTGLGLTFCQMAVEAHGGKIWVESDVGQGSVFSFNLPAAGPPIEELEA